MMWSSYYHYVCNFWQMSQVMFNYSLTIEKLIFNSNLWVSVNLFNLFKDIFFILVYSKLLLYNQTETTLVCICDCCVVKVVIIIQCGGQIPM